MTYSSCDSPFVSTAWLFQRGIAGASAAFDGEDHYDDGARHVYPAGLGRDCWRVKEILDVGLNKE